MFTATDRKYYKKCDRKQTQLNIEWYEWWSDDNNTSPLEINVFRSHDGNSDMTRYE